MKITSKGQVTIPREIREQAGFLPDTEVEFHFDGSQVTLVKASSVKKPSRGQRLIQQMRGRGDVALTTAQIMALTRGE